MQLAKPIRAMRFAHWAVVFGLILGGWMVLYAMALPEELRAASKIYGAAAWEAICATGADEAGMVHLVAMWAAMSAAMMLPTFLPALATFEELSDAGASNGAAVLALVAGYLTLWLGFSVLAALAQSVLLARGVLTPLGDATGGWLSAALLGFAGAYQFSTIKAACLSKCRAPLTFFMQYWQPGVRAAFGMGARLGAVCLGCCWALMLLGFVGGGMSLLWMGGATLLMILEKLPQAGRYVSRPLGFVLLAAAPAVLVLA